MITFVDTNVILDVLLPDPVHGKKSLKALEKAYQEGSLIINEIIYAELSPQFESMEQLNGILSRMSIRTIPIDQGIAYYAGKKWKKYKDSGGKRDRILADFLIASHARSEADSLLTRDRGFYRKYFKDLKIEY